MGVTDAERLSKLRRRFRTVSYHIFGPIPVQTLDACMDDMIVARSGEKAQFKFLTEMKTTYNASVDTLLILLRRLVAVEDNLEMPSLAEIESAFSHLYPRSRTRRAKRSHDEEEEEDDTCDSGPKQRRKRSASAKEEPAAEEEEPVAVPSATLPITTPSAMQQALTMIQTLSEALTSRLHAELYETKQELTAANAKLAVSEGKVDAANIKLVETNIKLAVYEARLAVVREPAPSGMTHGGAQALLNLSRGQH